MQLMTPFLYVLYIFYDINIGYKTIASTLKYFFGLCVTGVWPSGI